MNVVILSVTEGFLPFSLSSFSGSPSCSRSRSAERSLLGLRDLEPLRSFFLSFFSFVSFLSVYFLRKSMVEVCYNLELLRTTRQGIRTQCWFWPAMRSNALKSGKLVVVVALGRHA